MEQIYKKLLLVFVGFLIVPQIATAIWWNPFSWKVFNKTPATKVQDVKQLTEIEKSKNEVETLKKKIVIPASSSPVSTKNQSQKKDEKNYVDFLVGSLSFPLAQFANSKGYAEKEISRVKDAIQSAKKDRASFTGFRDNDSHNVVGMNATLNYLIESYNNEIQYYEKTLNNFNNIITRINANINLLKEEKTRMLPLSFTKDQVTSEMKRIDNNYSPINSSIIDEIDAVADNFVKYHDDKQNEYEEFFAYLKARLGPSALPDVTVKILTP